MHSYRGQSYDLLNLDQTYDVVCKAASVAIIDPSPADVSPYADYYGDFKGTINMIPPKNDTDIGAIND